MSAESPHTLVTLANRMLTREAVLDAFGHVSMRHPTDPGRFFLTRSIAPELATEADVLEYDLSGEPVSSTGLAQYSERIIHSVLYRMRPDVNAICHHHSPSMMPFCLADLKLRVVTQLGAAIGRQVPMWDQREGFGATNHLVTREAEALSLAMCLGDSNMVLMKRHGATVVGGSMRELVFRSIYGCRDAELQLRALTFGDISVFTDEEIALAGKFPEATLARAWEYWRSRLPNA
ncbi:class II aldolase/adducin family protein [Undibacter mobilis]|uniref:Class II aldolase/adducin family protein n=1 Tax=Undibacter mobilis TaxID=2292256 RepID=A0A371B362_9BRAD|nr:class II aldolase/adducin family protein [Undibacter mobilis]RDV01990.1 class II aldolase/adducin family protein [Undibacter mobilis]